MTMISERPAEVEDCIPVGHWEGDCIVGAANRSAIGTLVERRTRFLILVHVPTGRPTAEVMRQGITTALNRFPAELRRTLTWDQGKELTLHQKITEQTGAKVFFCDAHSPWQRGSNENMNGLLRDYFPKGIDLRDISPAELEGGCRDQQPAPQDARLGTARPTARPRDAVSQRLTLQPQKIEVGSRSISASNSSTLSVAGTRSYSWNR
jgi:transposase, IS30 family